jgi:hypothetical protein
MLFQKNVFVGRTFVKIDLRLAERHINENLFDALNV